MLQKNFPNIEIKFCVWHFKKTLDNNKNRFCNAEMDADNDLFKEYKVISNLPFINPDYIAVVFFFFKLKMNAKENNFLTSF